MGVKGGVLRHVLLRGSDVDLGTTGVLTFLCHACRVRHRFMADYEAWQQAADLYLELGQYEKALFCFEELILSNPHNYLYHLKCAEVRGKFGLCLLAPVRAWVGGCECTLMGLNGFPVAASFTSHDWLVQVLYTMGDYTNARKYYGQTVKVSVQRREHTRGVCD